MRMVGLNIYSPIPFKLACNVLHYKSSYFHAALCPRCLPFVLLAFLLFILYIFSIYYIHTHIYLFDCDFYTN